MSRLCLSRRRETRSRRPAWPRAAPAGRHRFIEPWDYRWPVGWQPSAGQHLSLLLALLALLLQWPAQPGVPGSNGPLPPAWPWEGQATSNLLPSNIRRTGQRRSLVGTAGRAGAGGRGQPPPAPPDTPHPPPAYPATPPTTPHPPATLSLLLILLSWSQKLGRDKGRHVEGHVAVDLYVRENL